MVARGRFGLSDSPRHHHSAQRLSGDWRKPRPPSIRAWLRRSPRAVERQPRQCRRRSCAARCRSRRGGPRGLQVRLSLAHCGRRPRKLLAADSRRPRKQPRRVVAQRLAHPRHPQWPHHRRGAASDPPSGTRPRRPFVRTSRDHHRQDHRPRWRRRRVVGISNRRTRRLHSPNRRHLGDRLDDLGDARRRAEWRRRGPRRTLQRGDPRLGAAAPPPHPLPPARLGRRPRRCARALRGRQLPKLRLLLL